MMRQVGVLGLSLIPFTLATVVAFVTWEALEPLAVLWRLIVIVLAWIVAFASGSQVFWKVVGLFSSGSTL
jgi:hypothetical protein